MTAANPWGVIMPRLTLYALACLCAIAVHAGCGGEPASVNPLDLDTWSGTGDPPKHARSRWRSS